MQGPTDILWANLTPLSPQPLYRHCVSAEQPYYRGRLGAEDYLQAPKQEAALRSQHLFFQVRAAHLPTILRAPYLAQGESIIKYKYPLSVLKDTYDYSCH